MFLRSSFSLRSRLHPAQMLYTRALLIPPHTADQGRQPGRPPRLCPKQNSSHADDGKKLPASLIFYFSEYKYRLIQAHPALCNIALSRACKCHSQPTQVYSAAVRLLVEKARSHSATPTDQSLNPPRNLHRKQSHACFNCTRSPPSHTSSIEISPLHRKRTRSARAPTTMRPLPPAKRPGFSVAMVIASPSVMPASRTK